MTIVRTPDVVGGRARIDGTRLTTHHVRVNVKAFGVEKYREWWPQVTVEEIQEALAYERRWIRRIQRRLYHVVNAICERSDDLAMKFDSWK